MFRPHVILHPTDLSENSRLAYSIAVDLAKQNQAQLLILHVVETLGPENVTFGEAASQLEPASYQERLKRDLQVSLPPAADVATHYLLSEGDPAVAVQRLAREHHCDLIVISTHGRTGLARLLMGSNAERIIRLAPCSLLVVKQPIPEPAEPSRERLV